MRTQESCYHGGTPWLIQYHDEPAEGARAVVGKRQTGISLSIVQQIDCGKLGLL